LKHLLGHFPPNVQGAIWMTLCGLGFSVMASMVKLASRDLSGFEIAFFRALFGFVVLLPFILRRGLGALHTRHLGMHMWRGLLGIFSMICAYIGISKLALANYTALSFTKPLFAVVLAVLVLGEEVRWRRWAATIVGFLGVVVMIRPGSDAFSPWAILALGDAFAIALLITIVKRLPESETPLIMLFYFGLAAVALSFPLALWFWRWPAPGDWLLLMGIGASGALSQYWWILAFRAGEASAVAPFDYLRLLFAGAIGIVFFLEYPDLWTYLGAAIIVGSTIYIAQRESALKHSTRADAVKSEAMVAERPEA
jgi:drug/metabolite transporter (DMT)-like permease